MRGGAVGGPIGWGGAADPPPLCEWGTPKWGQTPKLGGGEGKTTMPSCWICETPPKMGGFYMGGG